jgi:hypothetical protein
MLIIEKKRKEHESKKSPVIVWPRCGLFLARGGGVGGVKPSGCGCAA